MSGQLTVQKDASPSGSHHSDKSGQSKEKDAVSALYALFVGANACLCDVVTEALSFPLPS